MKLLLVASLFLTGAVHAACEGEPIFSCKFKTGKQVDVCDAASKINYMFGMPGKAPEMALSVPRSQASTYQWAGFGRAETYSVTIPNGNVSYTVFASFDRLERRHEGSLVVEKNQKHLATLDCVGKVTHRLEGIQLRPSE